MSWMELLYRTYNNVEKSNETKKTHPLYPVAHTTQNVNVEVWVDIQGRFLNARVIENKEDRKTLIPCTEESANRSGAKVAPHPLTDKLQYCAGDYTVFGGTRGDLSYQKYLNQLKGWCDSEQGNKLVQGVYFYLKQGKLIGDLIQEGILHSDPETGYLLKKWQGKKEDEPKIFKNATGTQLDTVVRFRVEDENGELHELWQDKTVIKSFIDYYLTHKTGEELCYVSGKKLPKALRHPSKIRHTGDMAKLISANDKTGFTYRGRFTEPTEVVQVSYEVSQKAHNALKWLIEEQGRNFGDKVFLLWGTYNEKLPQIMENSPLSVEWVESDEEDLSYTEETFAKRFNHAIDGYFQNLTYLSQTDFTVAVIVLDAASKGRLSITFYREYYVEGAIELFNNIKKWHIEGAWRQSYINEEKKRVFYTGVPSLREIAKVAFGVERSEKIEISEKLLASTIQRLLPCILDGNRIPTDIVRAAVQHAKYPQNYKNKNNWENVVTTTCSLVKKYEKDKGVEWKMAVDKNSKDISYNCGRLLAVADIIERSTFEERDRYTRTTNAMRYFTKFAQYPCRTWKIISLKLIPYIENLSAKNPKTAFYLLGMKQEISAQIDAEAFVNEKNLDGRMILGFDAQKNEIYRSKKNK